MVTQFYVLPGHGRDSYAELVECARVLEGRGIDFRLTIAEVGYGSLWIDTGTADVVLKELSKIGFNLVSAI